MMQIKKVKYFAKGVMETGRNHVIIAIMVLLPAVSAEAKKS